MDRMCGMDRVGRLELTVFQDGKPLITYFLFPDTRVAFRKFRSGEKRGEVEEVDYHFAFEACKQLSRLGSSNGRKVRGNFLRYYNHHQQKSQKKDDVRMEKLKKERKIELWCF